MSPGIADPIRRQLEVYVLADSTYEQYHHGTPIALVSLDRADNRVARRCRFVRGRATTKPDAYRAWWAKRARNCNRSGGPPIAASWTRLMSSDS